MSRKKQKIDLDDYICDDREDADELLREVEAMSEEEIKEY